jgi:preprotein translocase subunit SecE
MANEKDTKVEKAVKPSKEEKAAKKAKIKAAKEAAKNVAQKEGKPKLGLFAKIAKFFRDYKSEFNKLVWPTRQQLVKNSSVVLVSVIVSSAALALLDWGLDQGVQAIYNLVSYILPY